jgi:hypothetical protein
MTRVTFGMYRKGVREPNTTLASAAAAFTAPTPMPTASATITRHHRDGSAAARTYMDRSYRQSPYWGQEGTPQAGWANAMRNCYDTYAALAREDNRTAFATGLNRDLVLGADELAVHIDVVLLDPDGYVPRLVLWDANELIRPLAIRYAAPAWRVMEDELGEGRVASVEVWSLRQPIQIAVGPAEARAAMSDVARIVQRLVS